MTTGCCHHWMIKSPSGPVSVGRCKRCNEKREFRNTIVDPVVKGWRSVAPLWLGKAKDATKWPVEEKKADATS